MPFADTAFAAFAEPWYEHQWPYIRENLGEWHGWFRQFSPTATWVQDIPSVLTLVEDQLNQHMSLVLHRRPEGKPPQTLKRELGYPGAAPYICFFPTGAFSQGVMQRRPWSSFGAEFSLLFHHRRLRLAQLYNGTASGEHCLGSVTLIPEYRAPHLMAKPLSPITDALSLDSVLGTWHGDVLYLPATMAAPQVKTSRWQAHRSGTEIVISDTLRPENSPQCFQSVDAQRWQAVEQPQQYWLLPDGVSCVVYPRLPREYRLYLEVCWYLSAQQRQRILRDYDAQGNWLGTCLALESRL